MKILLITDSFPPEIRSASHLMLELADELNKRQHNVTVITTWPEYNLDTQSIQKKISEIETKNNITIIRVKTPPHHNVNYLIRGFSQLIMPLQFIWKLWRYQIITDATIVYSPPLPLALVGIWFKLKKIGFVLNVQDLFPRNAIDLKILTNPFHKKFFLAVEKMAYRYADVVTLHSKGNQQSLKKQFPNLSKKFRILHNWVDLDFHKSDVVQIDFRQKWDIQQKIIAIFAGVMGPSQNLELILRIAENFQNNRELLFLFVGNGKEKNKLQKLTKEKSLNNVRFEGFVSREAYIDLLKICSIGLVCLSPENTTPVVPGKILGYMAAGLPIAAFLQSSSDGHFFIKSAQCGFSANSSDEDACVELMKNLLSQKYSFPQFRQNGKKYAKKHFSKQICISKLESILEEIIP